MRIVQAATFVGPRSGGLRTTLDRLALGYAAAGHEVVQVVPGARAARTPTAYGEQVTVRAPAAGRTGYRVILRPERVHQLVADLAPDRLEVHDRTTLRGLGGWARDAGVPALVISHERLDRLLELRAPRPARRLPLLRWADASNAALAAAYDSVVATTDWAAAEFARLGVANLRRVPLGVDLDTFHPRRRDAALRADLVGSHRAEVLLVHASRLSPEKRSDLAVDAAAELARRGVPVRLVVAGDGSQRRRLERRARGLPVTFLGFVSDRARLAALLATADVVLAPGPVETFGLAALEALAAGTPVVGRRDSALAELLTAGAGVAVAGTAAALADGVHRLLRRSPGGRRAAARRRATDYPWAATVDGFLALHGLPPVPVARSA